MAQRTLITLLVWTALVGLVSSSDCSPQAHIPDLWAGTAIFSLPSVASSSLAYSFEGYTLPTPRAYDSKTNLQFCFALKDFAVSRAEIFYFDLIVLKTYQSSLVLSFIYEPSKWTKVAFNYWLSFRNDLTLALESFGQGQFQLAQGKGLIQSGVNLPPKQTPESCLVIVFLVGLRLETDSSKKDGSNRLSFAIEEQFLDGSTLNIHFRSGSPLRVDSITVSYLIYAPSMVAFGSYGGIVSDQSVRGGHYRSLSYMFPNHNFKALFGVSAFEVSPQADASLDYRSDISEYFILSYSVQEWQELAQLELTYVVAGVLPFEICAGVDACRSQGRVLIHEHECVARCPSNTKVVRYVDRSIECQQCPPNEIYSAKKDVCECKQGYRRNGQMGNCQLVESPLLTRSKKVQEEEIGGKSGLGKDCLKMVAIQQSNNNIFLSLAPSPEVLQDRRNAEPGFLKITFPNHPAPVSYYCNWAPREGLFQCLLLFVSGLPSSLLTIRVTCEVEVSSGSRQCELSVPYRPL